MNGQEQHGKRWSSQDLSQLLFELVKPICVQLSQQAVLSPDELKRSTKKIATTLKQLLEVTDTHYNQHKNITVYTLSSKVGDYIFFPISGLLKQTDHLDAPTVTYILQLICFLMEHCWTTEDVSAIADQVYPLTLFLVQKFSLDKVSLDTRKACTNCINVILKTVPSGYFDDKKRLSWLGSSITIYLDIVERVGQIKGHDETHLVIETLDNLRFLVSRIMTGQQASEVFPGVTSRIIKFVTSTSGLHVDVYIRVLKLLLTSIIVVLNDKALGAKVNEERVDLETILLSLSQSIKSLINFTTEDFNNDWHKATTQQLLIILTVLFKDLLKTPNKRRMLYTNIVYGEALHAFFVSVIENCFLSLYDSCIPFLIDSLVLLIPEDESSWHSLSIKALVNEIAQSVSFPNYAKRLLFYELSRTKLEDLLNQKMLNVFLSSDSSRIINYICSVRVHFQLVLALSTDLMNDSIQLGTHLLLSLRDNLLHASTFNSGFQTKLPVDTTSISNVSEHSLDGIDLGPTINTKSIVRQGKKSEGVKASQNVLALSHNWQQYQNTISTGRAAPVHLFRNVYDKEVESAISHCVRSIVSETSWLQTELLRLTESLLVPSTNNTGRTAIHDKLGDSISLWIAKIIQLLQSSSSAVAEFLDFGDSSETNELSYMILNYTQDALVQVPDLEGPQEISVSARRMIDVTEKSIAVSMDTIAELSGHFSHDEFQSMFLVDNLYYLFEAVALQSETVRSSSLHALSLIVQNLYDGSIEKLVEENLDYIIDSLSLRLALADAFTLSLPSILLIIIKVNGKNLLLQNQLSDVLSQIFILIDYYHGYPSLVECFFIIFDELITQVCREYAGVAVIENIPRPFAPWGMQLVEQFESFVSNSGRVIDPFRDYDSEKEYFKRKEGVPFSEQLGDSDDEDGSGHDEMIEESTEKEYTSPIPKPTYFTLQKIYVYGFRLLTTPSIGLKRQILSTLRKVYPLLATQYSLIMPLVADQWHILISVASGQYEEDSIHNTSLVISALELALAMVCEDQKHRERFLGSRFIQLWTLLETAFASRNNRHSPPPQIRSLVSRYLLEGLRTYGQDVLDSTLYTILNACEKLGIPEDQFFTREMTNTLWAVRQSRGNSVVSHQVV